MPARNIDHDAVRDALVADGWTITHDPLTLTVGERPLHIALGAELVPFAAEKGTERIAVDKLTRYRDAIRQVMTEYAAWKPQVPTVSSEQIHDPIQDHYELKYVGWDGPRRVHSTAFHLDIIGGKIWVQFDGSNRPVAEALVEAGVPKEDIVLAEQPPRLRPHTGYGVG
jgi:hypothetical protein